MSQVTSATQTNGENTITQPKGNGIDSLDQDQFLSLIITQLQNQDPLEPTDNAALMQQVSDLRSLAANDSLMDTLGNFSVTQQLTTASNLIGKSIEGLDVDGSAVEGVVSSVSVQTDENDPNNRQIRVHVGSKLVDIKNVREILPVE